jgi:hydrophobic/amphiphilic exporter-1 (mainly G- bacteria), HAE1 family
VSLKDWDKRTKPEESYQAIKANLAKNFPHARGDCLRLPAARHRRGRHGRRVHHGSGGPERKDIPFLAANVAKFMEAARKRPEIASINTTFLPAVPQLYVDVDRTGSSSRAWTGGGLQDAANIHGRVFCQLFQPVRAAVAGLCGSRGEYRTAPKTWACFTCAITMANPFPCRPSPPPSPFPGPEFTMRYNLYRSAQINGTAAPGYSSAQATKALEEVFAQTMPPEMGYDYIGMSFQEQKAAQGVSPAAIFALSFLFVFLILAALYESWSLPFSVLLGTPIAVFGAFAAALLCRQMVNNVFAQIGLVMLIGLAAKNAILIVEFARLEYEKGKPLIEAALTGARLRLRPILMTSFAFIFGSLPLWFATGAGAVSRRILGHGGHWRHAGRNLHRGLPDSGHILRGRKIASRRRPAETKQKRGKAAGTADAGRRTP